MSHILQPHPGTAPLHPQRQHAVHEGVARDERHEDVAQRACAAELRPREQAAVGAAFGAVVQGGLAAAVQAQEEAGSDVGEERGEDEEGFGEGRLVVGPGEEEVGV